MIDVVAAESGSHELLEQVGLFVRALRGAETCERPWTIAITDLHEPGRGTVERLVPRRIAEMRVRISRINELVRHLRHALLADERLKQALRVVHIVEAEAALHA